MASVATGVHTRTPYDRVGRTVSKFIQRMSFSDPFNDARRISDHPYRLVGGAWMHCLPCQDYLEKVTTPESAMHDSEGTHKSKHVNLH